MISEESMLKFIEENKIEIRFIPHENNSELDLWMAGGSSAPKLQDAILLEMGGSDDNR